MRVITIREVIIREGSPSPDAPEKGILNEGFVLEVEEVTGDPIDGNDVWYRDGNGDYLWSGDLNVFYKDEPTAEPIGPLTDYNMQIVEAYPTLGARKGSGVTVAVLDTGVYRSHPDLEQLISTDHVLDFIDSSADGSDLNGHGTHLTGLIAARTSRVDGIIGVAPECEVYVLKVLDDEGIPYIGALIEALDWIAQHDIDVVNMSLHLGSDEYPLLKDNIKTAAESGSIFIGAAGSNTTLIKPYPYYPAGDPYVLSTGAMDRDFLAQHQGKPGFSDHIDFIFPYLELRSTGPEHQDNYVSKSGSSIAAAILSGLVALITDELKMTDRFNPAEVKTALLDLSEECDSEVDMEALTLIRP